jgi:hypothetical protein
MAAAGIGVHDAHPAAAQETRHPPALAEQRLQIAAGATAVQMRRARRRLEDDALAPEQLGDRAVGRVQQDQRLEPAAVDPADQVERGDMTTADDVAHERKADDSRNFFTMNHQMTLLDRARMQAQYRRFFDSMEAHPN